jgi:hypothetical protein
MNWLILVVAFICLGSGIALFLWAVRRPRARYVNSTNLIAWLLIGLFPTLILFSFFPDSSAEGQFVGIGVSGAVAAFCAFLLFGSRAGAAAIARDQRFNELEAENERLRAQSAAAAPDRRHPIGEQLELRYRMTKKPVRELVILTGELIDVRGVDVWVSSENTYMQMARYYDRSVSSMVRYLGAYKDAGGHPVEDVVADELAARMLEIGSMGVQPATVITTGSGELETTHGVRRIYHVAAAQGQVGVGYVPVGNIAECVTNALAELDREEVPSPSILFPLLGLGTASGDSAIVSQLMAAAAQYVRQHPDSSVRKICFLVRHFEDLDLAVAAAGTVETLTRVGGSAETLLDRAPAAAAS